MHDDVRALLRRQQPRSRARRPRVALRWRAVDALETKSLARRLRFMKAHLLVLFPCAGACVAGVLVLPLSAVTVDLAMMAAWLVVLGLAFCATAHGNLTRQPDRTERLTGNTLSPPAIVALTAFAFVVNGAALTIAANIVVDLLAWPGGAQCPWLPMLEASTVSALAGVSAAFVLAAGRIFGDLSLRRAIRAVLGAAALGPSSRPGRRVRLVGVVRDPTPIPVSEGQAAFALSTDEESDRMSNPNVVVVRTPAADRTFFVEGGGALVEVDPTGIVFAAGARRIWEGPGSEGNFRKVTIEYVAVGTSVVVSGVLAPTVPGSPLRLEPSATARVYLMRFDPNEDPLALLWRARALNWLVTLMVLAAAAGTAVAAWALTAGLRP